MAFDEDFSASHEADIFMEIIPTFDIAYNSHRKVICESDLFTRLCGGHFRTFIYNTN